MSGSQKYYLDIFLSFDVRYLYTSSCEALQKLLHISDQEKQAR